jgi:membrane-anchored protein YejM (alkaline phosphatase superfamily)
MLIQGLRKRLRFWLNELSFKIGRVELKDIKVQQNHDQMNILWLVYDSCRYDSLVQAHTPTLDRYGKIHSAWTPGTYTLPAHISFFTGILPMVYEPIPYLNRFTKQLITMNKAGQASKEAEGSKTIKLKASRRDMIHGLSQAGYFTVGSGAATWFDKEVLTKGFRHFKYRQAQSAEEQCNFILRKLSTDAVDKPFFAFINFIETHTPYMHYGPDREEYSMQARDYMNFPPQEDYEMRSDKGQKLHQAQIKAAEHLDAITGELLSKLPLNTLVMIMSDHGECFGEDGFWGHGIYHPLVMNVPLMCFMLNGEDISS